VVASRVKGRVRKVAGGGSGESEAGRRIQEECVLWPAQSGTVEGQVGGWMGSILGGGNQGRRVTGDIWVVQARDWQEARKQGVARWGPGVCGQLTVAGLGRRFLGANKSGGQTSGPDPGEDMAWCAVINCRMNWRESGLGRAWVTWEAASSAKLPRGKVLVKVVAAGQRGTGGGRAYWGLVGTEGHVGRWTVQKSGAWGPLIPCPLAVLLVRGGSQ